MRKTLSIVCATVLATVMIPAVAAAAPSAVKWGACPAEVAAPGLDCSTLKVPLDYRDHGGRKIDVAISRLASKNPAKRRGILLLNEGGPGGAGLSFPSLLQKLGLPQSVQDAYDVIGFDPRGVGRSTPVTCDMTVEQQQYGNIPPYARDAADVVKRAKEVKQVARQCTDSKSGWMPPFVTTANTARDMDQIRAVLGEEKLSYTGYSYGTDLGAVYTTMFPQRSDRILLDSNLGPGGLDSDGGRLFGLGMEERFPDFAKFAPANPKYGLGSTPEEVTSNYHALAARLDASPEGGIDGAMFRNGVFGRIYGDANFPALAELWHALDKGQKLPDGPPDPPGTENWLASHLYVICGGTSWPKSTATCQRDVAADHERFPLYGASTANIRPCADWPKPIEPAVRITGRGPSNVLMVQNQRDPGTPLAGAVKPRQALGDRARMVVVDQGGHGTYLLSRNTCVKDLVTTYLTTGQRPDDRFCLAEKR